MVTLPALTLPALALPALALPMLFSAFYFERAGRQHKVLTCVFPSWQWGTGHGDKITDKKQRLITTPVRKCTWAFVHCRGCSRTVAVLHEGTRNSSLHLGFCMWTKGRMLCRCVCPIIIIPCRPLDCGRNSAWTRTAVSSLIRVVALRLITTVVILLIYPY